MGSAREGCGSWRNFWWRGGLEAQKQKFTTDERR